MGLTQSTTKVEQPTPAETPVNTNDIKETPSTTPSVEAGPAIETPLVETPSVEPTKDEKVEEIDNPSEVFERYTKKPGTKVEIAPVEVAASDDVVKKTKRKNKNKNKGKQNEKTTA
jgi:hypothetical protein